MPIVMFSETFVVLPAQTQAMSPLQAARAVMQALSNPATFSRGVAMQRRDCAAAGQPPAAAVWREQHGTVFVDPSGFLNLAAHVSQSGLAQVSGYFQADWMYLL